LVLDSYGNLFIADTVNSTIRKLAIADNSVTTVAGQAGLTGNSDGANLLATFHYPSGIGIDIEGNLYVADTDNNTLREISSGAVSTIAGLAGAPGSADGIGTGARFNFPTGLAVVSPPVLQQGVGTVGGGPPTIYVADTNNDTIRACGVNLSLPVITVQPQSQSVNTGQSATFSVSATGAPPSLINGYISSHTLHSLNRFLVRPVAPIRWQTSNLATLEATPSV
jgi:hypothetical protein